MTEPALAGEVTPNQPNVEPLSILTHLIYLSHRDCLSCEVMSRVVSQVKHACRCHVMNDIPQKLSDRNSPVCLDPWHLKGDSRGVKMELIHDM